MGRYCIVEECPNHLSTERSKDIGYHRFPMDQGLRNKWALSIQVLNKQVVQIVKSSVVCTLHFEKCFLKKGSLKAPLKFLLRNYAVPTIFPRAKGENIKIEIRTGEDDDDDVVEDQNDVEEEEEPIIIGVKEATDEIIEIDEDNESYSVEPIEFIDPNQSDEINKEKEQKNQSNEINPKQSNEINKEKEQKNQNNEINPKQSNEIDKEKEQKNQSNEINPNQSNEIDTEKEQKNQSNEIDKEKEQKNQSNEINPNQSKEIVKEKEQKKTGIMYIKPFVNVSSETNKIKNKLELKRPGELKFIKLNIKKVIGSVPLKTKQIQKGTDLKQPRYVNIEKVIDSESLKTKQIQKKTELKQPRDVDMEEVIDSVSIKTKPIQKKTELKQPRYMDIEKVADSVTVKYKQILKKTETGDVVIEKTVDHSLPKTKELQKKTELKQPRDMHIEKVTDSVSLKYKQILKKKETGDVVIEKAIDHLLAKTKEFQKKTETKLPSIITVKVDDKCAKLSKSLVEKRKKIKYLLQSTRLKEARIEKFKKQISELNKSIKELQKENQCLKKKLDYFDPFNEFSIKKRVKKETEQIAIYNDVSIVKDKPPPPPPTQVITIKCNGGNPNHRLNIQKSIYEYWKATNNIDSDSKVYYQL